MGKKMKKKARSAQKEKRVATASPQTVPEMGIAMTDTQNAVVSVAKEKKICPHLEKGTDIDKLSLKIKSSEPIKCEDCREGVIDRRARKGKSKHGSKNKGGGGGGLGDSKSDSKSVWVCLDCGQFSCGGAGFPTTPQSHAVRHARQFCHPLAVKFESPHLRWCFPCSSPIPLNENGEQKDSLPDVIKMIKSRPTETPSIDIEDVWFGKGSIVSEIKSDSSAVRNDLSDRYVVRGLVNLGNTCFFNSIIQNLLAMDKLRVYFLSFDQSIGPLTVSLKKLYIETNPDSGSRNIINPKPFFGSLCSKAPQFRGYQQHDSHELLRCLLDALSTEELSAKKESNSCMENGGSRELGPTLVDTIFGGRLSSTVCCLKCGHSSIVYEPFLDLSLPVPTKKPPAKKAGQSLARAKKPKLPPKRSGRVRPKVIKDTEAQSSSSTAAENLASSPVDSTPLDSQNLLSSQSFDDKKLVENVEVETETSTWLDYLDFGTMSNDDDNSLQTNDKLVTRHDLSEEGAVETSGAYLPNNTTEADSNESKKIIDQDVTSQMGPSLVTEDPLDSEPKSENSPTPNPTNVDSMNSREEEECPLQVRDSEILLLPYKEEAILPPLESPVEQSSLDFDGFGDLFNEPDEVVVAGPAVKPEMGETGFTVGNSSGSDPDEVDNSDSPVSVESCLAHFTKPEFLSKNEHAWQCESCSKALQIRRLRLKKKTENQESNGTSNADLGGGSMMNDARVELLESQVSDACSVNEAVIDKEASENEGEVSEDDDVADSVCVKVKRDATKRILINNAPPILTVHLKRFSQDARGRLSKLNGHVEFREIFDLRPYMNPRCTEKETYKYRLVGVVEHLGSMRGGHYIAYVRGGCPKKKKQNDDETDNGDSSSVWYHASDGYVREANLDEVLKCDAYILFYEEI